MRLIILMMFAISWVSLPIAHIFYDADYWINFIDLVLWTSSGLFIASLRCCAMDLKN